jgi:hypothetical protein
MGISDERRVNEEAYRRLEQDITREYAPGRFVAIAGGQIAADAESLDRLHTLLKERGKNPAEALVVRVGDEYPEYTELFSPIDLR